MLNSFWYASKANVFTQYYFIHDTTGTVPNVYRYVRGNNVYSTIGGVFFGDSSSIHIENGPEVNVADCSIEYTINCMSLSNTVVSFGDDLFVHPTDNGQLKVFDKLYCLPGTIAPYTTSNISYTASNGAFSIFLNGIQVGGPEPISGFTVSNIHVHASNAYVGYLRISNVFNMVGLATSNITKRIVTPYTDTFSYDPHRFREGIPSSLNHTDWTGWANLAGSSYLYLASPDGTATFAAGTPDGSPQIIGRTGDSVAVSSFQFSRVSNTHVPISIHAYVGTGLYAELDTGPVTWDFIQPVQFPEKFKIVQLSDGQALKIGGVDLVLRVDGRRLRNFTTGTYLRSNPLSFVSNVEDAPEWTFTNTTVSSTDGFSLFGYRFA